MQVKCRACGAVQCHGNGAGNGRCNICHYGRLPGWSFHTHSHACAYKGCGEPAVYADLPGSKKDCCSKHGKAILVRRSA